MIATFEGSQPNAITAAAQWLAATLTGSLASAVAIIAIAGLGLLLLSGRLPSRRALQLVVGCFIIFGAPAIAVGIAKALGIGDTGPPRMVVDQPVLAAIPVAPRAPTQPYDPYAGAALPPRR